MNKKFKQITREQNAYLIDEAADFVRLSKPKQGWIKTLRSALSMSGATLSKRLGGHRSIASYLERSELDGSVSLKKMQQVAKAMNCRFVYAIVPHQGKNINDLIEQQAEKIARNIVEQSSVQMMLEAQQLNNKTNKQEIQRLKKELITQMPRDFWECE